MLRHKLLHEVIVLLSDDLSGLDGLNISLFFTLIKLKDRRRGGFIVELHIEKAFKGSISGLCV